MSIIARTLDQLGVGGRGMAATSLRARYASGAFWSMAGAGLSQGLGLVAAVVVARLLGPDRYGDLGMVRSTTATFGIFAGFGLGYTATKHLAGLRTSDPKRAGRVWGLIDNTAIIMSLLAAALLLLLAPTVAQRMLHAPHLTGLLRLGVLLLVFNVLMQIQNAALAGLEAFRKTAAVELARGLINFSATIIMAYLWGLPGAIVGLGIAAAGGFAAGRTALYSAGRQHGISLQRRGVLSERKVLWESSLPAFSSSMMLILGEWLCTAMLFRQAAGDTQLGLYTAAGQWLGPIEFVPMILAGPSLSMLSNLHGAGDARRFRKLVLASVGLVFAFTVVTAGAVAVFAPWILRAYGERYAAATTILQVTCAMVVMRATGRATSQAIVATGRFWVEFTCSFIRMAVQLLLLALFFLPWGGIGLGLSMLIAFTIQLVLQSGYLYVTIGKAPSQARAT